MTKDEALRMALEAMEVCQQSNYGRDWVWPDTAHPTAMQNVKEAITAIREVLAEPEQKTCLVANESCKHGSWCSEAYCQEHCEFVAQPDQEPVAMMTVLHLKDRTEIGYGPKSAGYDLPTGEYKLYTSPPASKPWVGLTNEERNKLWRDVIGWGDPSHDDEELMKAIEAKLKEKNQCK